MNKKIKAKKILITLIVLCISLLSNNLVYAENTTKSSNANLSNLGIKPNDFSGFKMGTTTYNVTVPEDVKKVEVYATAQDAKAKVTGTGTKNLEDGTTAISVVVTAEDGTTKKYTVNITKKSSEDEATTDKTEEGTTTQNETGLSNIKISGIELSPEFKTNVYEYEADYTGEDTKLNISAVATDVEYIVEITGNENLKEGENLITILVSNKKGDNVATYQIKINKKFVKKEEIVNENNTKQEEQKKQIILISGAAGVGIVFLIIIILIVKHNKNKDDWGEDFTVPYKKEDEEEIKPLKSTKRRKKEAEEELYETDLSKEKAREKFLDSYNKDDYEEEKPKKHKGKGKRFK